MKTIPIGLLAVYTSGAGTLCSCLVVERTDGEFARFTSSDADVTVTGQGSPHDGTYLSATGLDVSSLVVQAGLAVDNMDLTVLPDEVAYPKVDIIAGRWDNASFRLFECSFADPTLGVNLLKRGTTGEFDTLRSSLKFEFRGLKQALQQSVGAVTSKTCRARLGDSACKVDLTSTDTNWTNDYDVTTVTSRHVIAFSAAAEAADFYGEGIATALDGENEGYSRKIKSFAAGVVTLSIEFPFTVLVGDSFRLVAGCRKRLLEDCKAKFNNVLNNQSEPHVPGADLLTADPVVSAS